MTAKIDYSATPEELDFFKQSVPIPVQKIQDKSKSPYASSDDDLAFFEQAKQENEDSTAQAIAQSPPVQAGLGRLQANPISLLASGLEMLSTSRGAQEAARIELQDLIDEPIPRNEEILQSGREIGEKFFPSQTNIEKGISHLTGIELQPQSELAKGSRSAGAFTKGMNTSSPTDIAQGLIGAAAGGGAERFLVNAGVPEWIAGPIAGILGGSIQHGKIVPRKVEGEEKELREIAQKHKLRKFAGMEEKETPKVIQPTITKARKENLQSDLSKTSEKAIERIIDEDIPFSKIIKNGHNPQEIIRDSYKLAYRRAAESKKLVDMSDYTKWIDNKISSLKGYAKSLSPETEKLIGILEKEKSAYTKINPKWSQSKLSEKFRTHPKYISESIPSEKILNQSIEHNKTVEKIWKKSEFSGMEDAVKNLTGEMKRELTSTLEKQGQKGVADAFKVGNKFFSDNEKLIHIRDIIQPAMENPLKFTKILNSKDGEYLKRYFSPKALNEIQSIGKYAQKAEEKIFDRIKTVPSFGDDLKTLGPLAAITLTGSKIAALKIAKDTAARVRGILLTRDSTRKDLENFMKASQIGSMNGIRLATSRLEDSVKKEFGSIDDFIRLATEDESSEDLVTEPAKK